MVGPYDNGGVGKLPHENFNLSTVALLLPPPPTPLLVLLLFCTCNKIVSLSLGTAIYSINWVYDHEFVSFMRMMLSSLVADVEEAGIVSLGVEFLLDDVAVVVLPLLAPPLAVTVEVDGSYVAK